MHPFFLAQLRDTLAGMGIKNPIVNPLELKTKGECIAECANSRLLRSIIDQATSCSHGTRKQFWARRDKEIRNCGYCVPCLIRRAGMHKAGLDDGTKYGIDVCDGELSPRDENDRANDLRAILNLIASDKSVTDLQRDIVAVASVDNLVERAKMLKRGIIEITEFLKEKGGNKVIGAARSKGI